MPKNDAVIGFFPKKIHSDIRRRRLEEELGRLRRENGILTRVSYRKIDEQNWAENWKAFFRPEKIGERIVVKPSWHEFSTGPADIVLEIDPGMAFGTGTHSTTVLCVRMIEKFLRKGDLFLDVGTGSGILMIAAAKLGASEVWGVDMDPAAVEIAESNLVRNAVEQKFFHVIHGNLLENIHESFDIISANLTMTPILALLENMGGTLRPAGIFICSGIMEQQEKRVAGRMKRLGFDILEAGNHEQWRAIAGRLNQ
jgi:ribosomal protein L11 methyltransferase